MENKPIYILSRSGTNNKELEVFGYFGALDIALEIGMKDGVDLKIIDQMWDAGKLYINEFTIEKDGVKLHGRRKL